MEFQKSDYPKLVFQCRHACERLQRFSPKLFIEDTEFPKTSEIFQGAKTKQRKQTLCGWVRLQKAQPQSARQLNSVELKCEQGNRQVGGQL